MTRGPETRPTVQAIHIAPASRLPMQAVGSVVAEADRGLVGDRYHGHRERHVSIQSGAELAAAAEILGRPIDPAGTRRNITISAGEIPVERGRRILVGPVLLEVFRMAAPCKLLDDELGPGAAKALRRRAGSICRIVSGGTIRIGDPVELDRVSPLDDIRPVDGDRVEPGLIPTALTAGQLRYEDGATQVFTADGKTTYTEHGRVTEGTWYVDGRSFCSFWPPSYTGCYDITWLVEAGEIRGLRFIDQRNRDRFVGRYER